MFLTDSLNGVSVKVFSGRYLLNTLYVEGFYLCLEESPCNYPIMINSRVYLHVLTPIMNEMKSK